MPPSRNITQKAAAELLDKLEKNSKLASGLSNQFASLSEILRPIIKAYYGNGKMSMPAKLEILENNVNKNTENVKEFLNRGLLPECEERVKTFNSNIGAIRDGIKNLSDNMSSIKDTLVEHNGILNTLTKWKDDQSSFKSKIFIETFKLIIAVAAGVILAKLTGGL